jgi:hypothetical protein
MIKKKNELPTPYQRVARKMTRAEDLQTCADQMDKYTDLVREHLHQHFISIGNKDFIFKTKKIARVLNLPIGSLKWVMYRLQQEGVIQRYNPRFYVTSFSKKTEVNIDVQVCEESLFEKLKKKFKFLK